MKTPKTFYINRRHFLKGSFASLVLSQFGVYGFDLVHPTKPYRVGLIGCGWYGKSDLYRLIQVTQIEVVALCDVDAKMLADAAVKIQQRLQAPKPARTYEHYEDMLAQEELDIVLIGSPDHWHALQGIATMKAGAHVYLQKPISVDVLEGEALVAAAEHYNKVVQVGLQRRSTPHLMQAKKEIIDAGLLGTISHVEMCCYYHMRSQKNPPQIEVPNFLNYDLWTGPAPLRPYDGLPHRGWWRAFMEYGNGIVGDMCVHMFDTVRWMLDLGWPKRVSSTGGIYVQKEAKSNITDTQTVLFEYPELNCVWQHRTWGNPVDPNYPWAFKIYGEKGMLAGSVNQFDFIPYDKNQKAIHQDVVFEREQYPEDVTEKDIELHVAPATRLHMLDFLAAISASTLPKANLVQGHISSASCILGNLALQLKRPLQYNPNKRHIENDMEATKLLARSYRKGWEHPKNELL